jgi:hypothetical protein
VEQNLKAQERENIVVNDVKANINIRTVSESLYAKIAAKSFLLAVKIYVFVARNVPQYMLEMSDESK